MAFELNGIVHYEPIYSDTQLKTVQKNDLRKFKFCHENNISLCIIDVSKHKYFKETNNEKYLNIIIDIINKHIN